MFLPLDSHILCVRTWDATTQYKNLRMVCNIQILSRALNFILEFTFGPWSLDIQWLFYVYMLNFMFDATMKVSFKLFNMTRQPKLQVFLYLDLTSLQCSLIFLTSYICIHMYQGSNVPNFHKKISNLIEWAYSRIPPCFMGPTFHLDSYCSV